MEKVKVMVVEDEYIVAEEISEILRLQGFEVVGSASSAEKAMELADRTQPDVALLDINIEGDVDGIELAKRLLKQQELALIFLTAFDEKIYIDRASGVEPAAYIVKPFESRNLIASIQLAFNKLTQSREDNESTYFIKDRIFIKNGSKFIKLMVEDIVYIEALGSYTDVYTFDKKITLTINLKQFAQKLDHPKFIRVHRSFVVNMEAIDSFEGNTIYIGASKIPISASYKEVFLKSIRTM